MNCWPFLFVFSKLTAQNFSFGRGHGLTLLLLHKVCVILHIRALLELKQSCEGWVGFCWLAVDVEMLVRNGSLPILYFFCLVWDQFILCRTKRESVCMLSSCAAQLI